MSKKNLFEKLYLFSFGLISFFFLFYFGFLILEPQLLKGATDSKNVNVYQQVVEEISLTCSSSVSGSPAINGITGGTANGTFSCNVITSNAGGYNMTLKKSGNLCHSEQGCGTDTQFDDYPGSTNDPIDFNWQSPSAGGEHWGFNVSSSSYPDSVTQRFKDNGSQCYAGSNVTDGKCWVRIPTSPTAETVVNRGSATGPSGDNTFFGLRFEAGSSNALVSGTYTTTLTVTVSTN